MYRPLVHAGVALALTAIAGSQPAANPAITVSAKLTAAGQFGVFEFSLKPDRILGNELSDVRVTGVFTAPDGRQKPINGFFAGTNVWKLRFAPDKPGRWSYTYEMRLQSGAVLGGGSDSFLWDPVPARASIAQFSQNSTASLLSGALGYPIGIQDCIPIQGAGLGLFAIDGRGRTDPENLVSAADYFAIYGGAGFNLFRFSQKNCSYDLYDDLDHYREAEMQITEQLLTLARSKNFHIMFGFFGNHNGYHNDWEHGGNPDPPDVNIKEKAFIDYCIARFGAFVDIWELLNERNAPDSWTSDMAAFVHAADPYGRPVSTSWERPAVPAIDINSPHWYESESELDSDLRVQQQAQNWLQFGKAVIVGEQGNTGMNWDPLSATRMRIRLWTSLFENIALVFWNTSWSTAGVNGGIYIPGSVANIYLGPEERGYTSALRGYSSRLPSGMSPVNLQLSAGGVRAYAMASGSTVAAYLHHFATHATVVQGLTIASNGAFSTGGSAQWIDPASGRVLSIAAVDSSGRLRVPDFAVDIALLISGGSAGGSTRGTAAFVASDSATLGSWKGVYGADGYNIIGDSASYPAYVTVTPSGNGSYTWASSTSDARALQKAASPGDRVAACWYSSSAFTIDLNFNDQNTHTVALYLLDYDNYNGRAETVEVLDANNTLLDSRVLSSFTGGQYLVWNMSGHVIVRITNANGSSNAVVSGLFFGGPSASTHAGSAAFVNSDSNTQGSWAGVYGADGYTVANDLASTPGYVTMAPSGNSPWTWVASTTDPRALQKPSSPADRLAACWYAPASMSFDLSFSDQQSHQVALYLMDWDNVGRADQVEILDANNNVLDSRSVYGFGGGQYWVWSLAGRVTVRITTGSQYNAVLSGIFFGSSP